MSEGFYLMHRGWMDNPVFKGEPYTKASAWCWLIEAACWQPTRVGVAGKTIELERGQLSHSLRFMAEKWRWDEARVRRFLTKLEQEGMISRCVDAASVLRRCKKNDAAYSAAQTIITICNYDKYQATQEPQNDGGDAAATQQRRSSDAKKKEVKEYINTSSNEEGAEAPRVTFEKEYFETGKRMLGAKAGGVLANLLKAKGSTADAYAVLMAASEAENPMEYVQGAMRERRRPPPQPARKPDPQFDEVWEHVRLSMQAGKATQ